MRNSLLAAGTLLLLCKCTTHQPHTPHTPTPNLYIIFKSSDNKPALLKPFGYPYPDQIVDTLRPGAITPLFISEAQGFIVEVDNLLLPVWAKISDTLTIMLDTKTGNYTAEGNLQSVSLAHLHRQMRLLPMEDTAVLLPVGQWLSMLGELTPAVVKRFHTVMLSFFDTLAEPFGLMAVVWLDREAGLPLAPHLRQTLAPRFDTSALWDSFERWALSAERLLPGKPFPVALLPYNLQSPFQQKMVIVVHFWASWCLPCRVHNPRLVQLYSRYRETGMEIISISMDRDSREWRRALNEDGLNAWQWHWCDGQGFLSPVARAFKVEAVPLFIVVGRNGTIVWRGFRFEELRDTLQRLLTHSRAV